PFHRCSSYNGNPVFVSAQAAGFQLRLLTVKRTNSRQPKEVPTTGRWVLKTFHLADALNLGAFALLVEKWLHGYERSIEGTKRSVLPRSVLLKRGLLLCGISETS